MQDSLYVDSLTGFNNILALVMADLNNVCGKSGTILSLDMKNLATINMQYGRELGDSYIALCASCISQAVASIKQLKSQTSVYRIGGDGFLIIFMEEEVDEIAYIAESLDKAIESSMREKGVTNAGTHYVYWTYKSTPESASALTQKANILLRQGVVDNPLPKWVIVHIEQMYEYIKDTLTLLEKTSEETLIDNVSQMPNNKAARQCLNRTLIESSIGQKSFSILFIDGDNLRMVNELGYEQGNELIRNLGKLIRSSVRTNDNVYRWLSGDEFLVILPDTSKEHGCNLAERIRSNVASSTSVWNFPVTISIGVATYPSDGYTIDDILEKAEKRNSKAKKEGKNCVRS